MRWVPCFCLLIIARGLSAYFNLIHDTDETYNYWEPLHFLLHGTGFQTWEYSPQFAIRSWTYILLHAFPIALVPREYQFYALRSIFALTSASIDTFLISTVRKAINKDIATLTFLGLLSTGFFNASTSFLPSTFTMYTSTLGLAFVLRRKYLFATISFGIGGILGWPFSLLLYLPLLLLTLPRPHWRSYFLGALICSVILLVGVIVDHHFYGRWVIVPLNIVLYNILSNDVGPELFGTEPLSYYFKNLVLNFNILFPLSLLGLPIALYHRRRRMIEGTIGWAVWLIVLGSQAHKEERFMYPAYASLVLSSSIAIHQIIQILPRVLQYRYILSLGSILISIIRIVSLVQNYSAPLTFFANLPQGQYCLGNDWYRFPTSFLIQSNVTISFTKSDFGGQLPIPFTKTDEVREMNNRNEFMTNSVTDSCACRIYWSRDAGPGATPFTDRESGVKVRGYYNYHC